jgi:hypothetical protein
LNVGRPFETAIIAETVGSALDINVGSNRHARLLNDANAWLNGFHACVLLSFGLAISIRHWLFFGTIIAKLRTIGRAIIIRTILGHQQRRRAFKVVKQLLVLASVVSTSGCGLTSNALHNLVNEPVQYVNEVCLTKKIRSLGKDAWSEYQQLDPENANSKHFAEGFVDGFSDYLENGGSGSPPAVPPPQYRRHKYLTPDGIQAVNEYLHGFVTGADAARGSGIRDTLATTVSAVPQPNSLTSPPLPTHILPAP